MLSTDSVEGKEAGVKQAILLVMAIVLGLALGCAGPRGGVEPVSMGDDDAPEMRMPSPEAAVYVPGQDTADAPQGDEVAVDPDDQDVVETSGPAYRFKVGDAVIVNITGITPPDTVEDIVDEKGFISMPYIGQVKAEGETASKLEEIVHKAYVPDYYKYATISVFVPSRIYYIRGEVRQPGRYPLVPGMTILQAVATAGGYTDYASKKVQLLRGGKTIKVNLKDLERSPDKDIPLKAQDQIIIPRGII